MKRNWLIYILVCSMGLNMGIIASFAYWRYGGQPGLDLKHPASPLPFRELTRSLNLGPEQGQIARGLLPEHQQRIGELRLGLAQKRQELFELLQTGEPSWPAIQDKTREISELQGKLEVEMVQFFLALGMALEGGIHFAMYQILHDKSGELPFF